MKSLGAEGISVSIGDFAPECLKLKSHIELGQASFFQEGLCQVQDEASILISHLLSPEKGERILDTCAGPGGKATHIAQLMKDEGEIFAIDTNDQRLKQLKDNYQRLKINSIKPYLQDARQIPPSWGEFDRILVDAPCSSLGVIRRHPDIKWLKREDELDGYQMGQLDILNGVKGCLRRGGILVYAVCSFEPEETIDVIKQYLADNPGFCVDREDEEFPGLNAEGFFVTLPSLSYEMDGVFAAKLKKVGQ
jgi:16S rRNA (cytosine967-C5)-methyltransferase